MIIWLQCTFLLCYYALYNTKAKTLHSNLFYNANEKFPFDF